MAHLELSGGSGIVNEVWGGGGLTGLNDLNIRPIPTKMEFFQ